MADEQRRDVILEHPNRDKASSKATKAIVILLSLASVALMLIVTIGGWNALEGAKAILIAYMAIYLILATYYLGFAIILEASLSFLGVGSPPDVASWGGMLTAAAQGHVTKAPWAGIFPGLAIFIAVLGFNLLGDAVRDVLEPRLRSAGAGARRAR